MKNTEESIPFYFLLKGINRVRFARLSTYYNQLLIKTEYIYNKTGELEAAITLGLPMILAIISNIFNIIILATIARYLVAVMFVVSLVIDIIHRINYGKYNKNIRNEAQIGEFFARYFCRTLLTFIPVVRCA